MFVSESSRKESAMTSKHHATPHKRGRVLYMWWCFKNASTSLVGSLKIDGKSVMDRVVKHRADCTDAKDGRGRFAFTNKFPRRMLDCGCGTKVLRLFLVQLLWIEFGTSKRQHELLDLTKMIPQFFR